MKVGITYYKFLDERGIEQKIGGIETYLLNLSKLCIENNMEPIIFQSSLIPFKKKLENIEIIGVPVFKSSINNQKNILYQNCHRYLDVKKDIIIFGADHCSIKTDSNRTISIQHGISWDLPSKYLTKMPFMKSGFAGKITKIRNIKKALNDFENSKNRVCVDYNFINWYRTINDEIKGRYWVIPNFCYEFKSSSKMIKKNSNIKILFARRFTKYRGVYLMADVINEILKLFQNISITFAGEGPEEKQIKNYFNNDKRVSFIKYNPNDALNIHMDHDIAVIPSLASEGTSISVAEAMGAGCCVIASAVGGITNMIINGYNGILIKPEKMDLLNTLTNLLNNPDLISKIGEKGRETAQYAFNINRWKEGWKNVLNEVVCY